MRAGQVLTVCADMPSSSKILEASPENPLLTFYFSLNQRIIKESLVEIKLPVSEEWRGGGVSVASADTDFMEAILRLATIIEKPDQIPARAELALRDLHLLLLLGPQGRVIRNFFGPGSFNNEIFAAIEYLRSNIDRVVCAKELARIANMSESTLYRYFKSLTGISPLQYHKKLRLHEGRRLILENNERASIAAYKTGYESVSQFSREYKKLFGKSPRQSRKE